MARHSLNRQKRPPPPSPFTAGRTRWTDKRKIVFAPTFELAIILAEPRRKRRVRPSVAVRPSVRPPVAAAAAAGVLSITLRVRIDITFAERARVCPSDRDRDRAAQRTLCFFIRQVSHKHWQRGRASLGFGGDYRSFSE